MLVSTTLHVLLLQVMDRMFEHFHFRKYFSNLFNPEVLFQPSKGFRSLFFFFFFGMKTILSFIRNGPKPISLVIGFEGLI